MNTKPVDKTKKSNIKCEHCKYGEKPKNYWDKYYCSFHKEERNYWNRCKGFEWREGAE